MNWPIGEYLSLFLILLLLQLKNFIWKIKFSSLPNFATCHFLNLCHMSNVYKTYHLSVRIGETHFFKNQFNNNLLY